MTNRKGSKVKVRSHVAGEADGIREQLRGGTLRGEPIDMDDMDAVIVAAWWAGYSQGYLQDPTHCNQINEATWAYFDPLEPSTQGMLYRIYKPKPWQIKFLSWSPEANLEVVLAKRREDKSYG